MGQLRNHLHVFLILSCSTATEFEQREKCALSFASPPFDACLLFHLSSANSRHGGCGAQPGSCGFLRESIDIIYGLLVNWQRTLSHPADATSEAWTSKTVTIGHVFYKSSFSCPVPLRLLHSKGHSTPRTKRFLLGPPHPWDRLYFPRYLCRFS